MSQPTDFQKKVYKVVKKIPKGQVMTYGWVARKIGRPGAARNQSWLGWICQRHKKKDRIT